MAGLLTRRSKDAGPPQRPTTPSTSRIMRHHEYYIPSADAAFLVSRLQALLRSAKKLRDASATQTGSVLFRVHRYFFIRESPIFQEMFRSRYSDLESPKRILDSEPIVLEDVGVQDFECFLWVIYNPYVHFLSLRQLHLNNLDGIAESTPYT